MALLLSLYVAIVTAATTETYRCLQLQVILHFSGSALNSLLLSTLIVASGVAVRRMALNSPQSMESLALDAALEASLAAVFGAAYLLTGSNIAVPIIGHWAYSFCDVFVYWRTAVEGIASRAEKAKAQRQVWVETLMNATAGADAGAVLPAEFDRFVRPAFDDIDLDGDSLIDAAEFKKFIERYSTWRSID